MNIQLFTDSPRADLREEVKSFIKRLIEENGHSIGEIISEFLIASAVSISNDEFTVSAAYLEEDEEDDSYYVGKETDEEYEARVNESNRIMAIEEEFESLEVTKNIAKLEKKLLKFSELKKPKETFDTEKEILSLVSEHAKEWVRVCSQAEWRHYYVPINLTDMCKTCAALLDIETINRINSVAKDIGNTLSEKYFSYEVFNVDHTQYAKDIIDMEKVYGYIRQNPGCKQAKLYSALSLDGRRIGSLIEIAMKHERINRIREKDTWLLNISPSA